MKPTVAERFFQKIKAEKAVKRKREVLGYIEPGKNRFGTEEMFAQCASCISWTGSAEEKEGGCLFIGPSGIKAVASCNYYVNGAPTQEKVGEEQETLSKEEAGYVEGEVRCENCAALDGTSCQYFAALNKALPDIFDLDIEVDPKGCCSGWKKK